MYPFGQITPSGLRPKRPMIGRGNPNGFQPGFPGQIFTDELTGNIYIKGTTDRFLRWYLIGTATGNPTVIYGASGDASPPGVLSAAGPVVWYGFYGEVYAKLTSETSTDNWFPILTLADVNSQGPQFFFNSFGSPSGCNGIDPVLGFPYPPVEYQLFISSPANFTDPVNLTWTVPSLVANPANYRIYNVSSDNLYYWRSNNPSFPGGSPTLVLPGAFSSVANSGGTNINLAYLWMAKVPTLNYGGNARAPLVIGPTSQLVGSGATPGTAVCQLWSNNAGSVIMWDERAADLSTPTVPPAYTNPPTVKVKAFPLGQNIIEFDLFRTNAMTPGKTGNFELWVQLPGNWNVVNGSSPPAYTYTDPSDAHALPRTTDYAAYFYKLIGYTDGVAPNNSFLYNIVYVANTVPVCVCRNGQSSPGCSPPSSCGSGSPTIISWTAPDVSWFPSLV